MGNEPVDFRTFGGVEFNWNQVKRSEVREQNGKTMYFIEFKSGVTAEYPMQKFPASMQSKELNFWKSMGYDTETTLNEIEGAKIQGSEKDDHIVATGLTNSTIDVSNDNNIGDHVFIKNSERKDIYANGEVDKYSTLSANNKLILGKHDTAAKKNETFIYTETNNNVWTTEERKSIIDVEGPGIENRF